MIREKEILRLIKLKYSLADIKRLLGVTHFDIEKMNLKGNASLCKYSNCFGDILYKETKKVDRTHIDMLNKNFLKVLVIADLHIGNELANEEYLFGAYEYALKNNIHHVFLLGDLIDGKRGKNHFQNNHGSIYSYTSMCPEEQIDYIVDRFPKASGIVTHTVLGNHDVLKHTSFISVLDKEREDFINLGFNNSKNIVIGNKSIKLVHPINGISGYKEMKADLYLRGHSHIYRVDELEPSFKVRIGTLSDMIPNQTLKEGEFAVLEIGLENNQWKNVIIKQMGIGDSKECSLCKNNINKPYIHEKTLVRKNY